MEKKQYIQPSMKVCEIRTSAMICGSGTQSATISVDNGTLPTAADGVIAGEAKSDGGFFDDDFEW